MTYNNQSLKLNFKLSCILLFSIIYINETLMFQEMYSATIQGCLTIGCFIVVCVCEMIKEKKVEVKIGKKEIKFYFLLIFCIFISLVFNGINITFDLYTIMQITIAFFIISIMEESFFYNALTTVMTFLAGTSTFIFLGYHTLFLRKLFLKFPDYYWHTGILIKNCYLAVLQVDSQHYRNFGIFREPGYYAVFLVWALFIAMFKKKINIKQVIILFAALATTFSTGGYVAGLLLLLAFLFNQQKIEKKVKIRIAIFLGVIVVIIIIFLIKNPSSWQYLTGKFSEVEFGQEISTSGKGSGYERWRAMVYVIETFFTSPIFGIGSTGWQSKFNSIITTATPINWFCLYGFGYGIFMNIFYIKNSIIRDLNGHIQVISSITLAIVLLWNVLFQNMSGDIIMFVLVFYQVNDKKYYNFSIQKERDVE